MTEQYPTTAPQPLFWQAVVTAAISMAMIIMLATWVFSQIGKAKRGEEVEKPFFIR